MSQFRIFYLLALFCIPFASTTQAERKEHCKIGHAKIKNKLLASVQTINNGDVYLYELTGKGSSSQKFYEVGDELGEISPKFLMAPYNVAVTGDEITIKYIQFTIKLTLDADADTFAFYEDLFSLGDFPHKFPVAGVSLGEKKLENVNAIKAIEVGPGEWLYAALEDSTPRLIFPRRFLPSTTIENSAEKVSFLCEPIGEKITIEFGDIADASTFYSFVKSPFLYQKQ